MSETRRKLTTIFSADVQGYTRLMRADEEGTLATLKQYRDAMGRLIEAHGGRVINTWGDGLIAEFPSVVEAVRAAIDVQSELTGYNAKRPTDTRMHFRIGINLGDVIAEGDDIYGDGVNVAARLQASAAAGGIVISNTVYDQVRNKVAVGFEFLGQLAVKNIDGGVPSYAVRIGAPDNGASPAERRDRWGRQPVHTQERTPTPSKTGVEPTGASGRKLGVLAVIAAGLVSVNLLTWRGEFWAAWPLLALAVASALLWVRSAKGIDRGLATLAVAGLGITGINLLSWEGRFWAIWPLLAIAIAAGLRWVTRRQHSIGR
jgi:class 3 adenylate cyclase